MVELMKKNKQAHCIQTSLSRAEDKPHCTLNKKLLSVLNYLTFPLFTTIGTYQKSRNENHVE